jgi:hypothetical protein
VCTLIPGAINTFQSRFVKNLIATSIVNMPLFLFFASSLIAERNEDNPFAYAVPIPMDLSGGRRVGVITA